MGIVRTLRKAILSRNENYRKFYREPDYKNPVFCSLDLETTGLSIKEDEIVAIGAVKIVNMKVDFSTTFKTFVKPKRGIKKESVLIHGIREEELVNAPTIEEILPILLEYIKGTILIGYFVRFDIGILSRFSKELLGLPILNPFIDIKELYQLNLKRKYLTFKENGEKSLDELAKEAGIPIEERHDALCDCLVTALLFIYLVKSGVNWEKALVK